MNVLVIEYEKLKVEKIKDLLKCRPGRISSDG